MNSTFKSHHVGTSASLSVGDQQIWSVFEQTFTLSIGYAPQDFRFLSGVTSMSTWSSMLAALVTYYTVVLGGRKFMRNQKPVPLNFAFKVHNLCLSVLSGILLVLMLEQIVPMLRSDGLFHSICERNGGWSDKLVVLYYVCWPINTESFDGVLTEDSSIILRNTWSFSTPVSWF